MSNARTLANLIDGSNIVVPSGYGLDFSANAHHSGMTSEILNDYEKGTWSPMSSTKAEVYHARYTKIDNLVTINCAFRMKSEQSQDSIALPFVPSNDGAGKNVTTNITTNNRYAGTVSWFEVSTSVTNLMLYHQGNQGANAYFIAQSGSQQWPEVITDTEYGVIAVSFTYQTG